MSMNAFELFASLSLDKSKYDDGLNQAEKEGETGGNNIASKLGNVAKVAGVALATATTAVASGIAVVTKQAVEGYAEYEQLVGGVQKLYGNMGMSLEDYAKNQGKSIDEVKDQWQSMEEAQNLVLENASNAYKTAGMSANAYMETATSFSASLINSLGGDVVESAKLTDVAMTAISDNFNTFGGDIEMVKGAFQGFAKQNYTMLDNLKLGYGGTKSEMERLIADANEYGASIGEASDLSIDSFADVVKAIDLVQQKQGIAGTTAREATTTIEGSLGMLKGAWENLLTGMGDSEADLSALIGNLVTSLVGSTDEMGNHINGFLDNLLPVVTQALSGIGQVVEGLAPILSEQLPAILESTLPSLVSAVGVLINGIITALPTLLSSLMNSLPSLLVSIIDSLLAMLPQLVTVAIQAIAILAQGIADSLPELIPALVDTVLTIVDTLIDNIDMLVDASIAIILGLAEGLIDALPKLIDKLPEIVIAITDALVENSGKIAKASVELIFILGKGLIEAIPTLIKNIPTIIKAVLSAFTVGFRVIGSIGKNIVLGIWDGIKGAKDWLLNNLKEWCDSIIDAIKGWFGIHSPSTVMRDQVGKYLAQGLEVGFEDEKPFDKIESDISKGLDDINADLSSNVSVMGGNNSVTNPYDNGIIDYDKLANAVAIAFEKSGLAVEIDDREFGRVVRKVAFV